MLLWAWCAADEPATARWAFDGLGVARLELTCGPDDEASQRVASRRGFVGEGVLRSHMPFPGGRLDTVMYNLLPGELRRPSGLPGW